MRRSVNVHFAGTGPVVQAGASAVPPSRGAAPGAWLRGILGLAVAVLLGLVAPATATAAPVCGVVAHWVDTCPTGNDFFPLTNGVHTIDIFGFGIISLLTTGPTTIWRGSGTTVPDHHIDTELVFLQLVGGGLTLTAGDGTANGLCDGPLCSLGRITEQSGDPTLADSFFDIFFEITGTPFGPLHNDAPCQMESVIDRVPPAGGTIYICNTALAPIFLLDANGIQRGQLLSATHEILTTPIPEPGSLALVGVALMAIAGLRRRVAGRQLVLAK